MTALSIQSPFPVFNNTNGSPLEAGYVYIGQEGLNPETNPIQVYFDSDLTIPAVQPIRTINGFASRNGSPAVIFADADNYSLLVKDKLGRMVFSSLSANSMASQLDSRLPEIENYAALRSYDGSLTDFFVRGVENILDGGFGVFRVDPSDITSADNGGTVIIDVLGRRWKRDNLDYLNILWFGADPTGIVSSDSPVRDAIAYGISVGRSVYVPDGTFLINVATSVIELGEGEFIDIFGNGPSSIIKLADGVVNSDFDRMFIFDTDGAVAADFIRIRNILIDTNTRGNAGPATTPSDSTYEHCHTIEARATLGTIRQIRYENVVIKDPCADGFNFGGTAAAIYQAEIIDCEVFDRTRLRRDIQFSVPPRIATVRNFRGTGIEAEHIEGSDTVGTCYLTITDTVLNIMDILGLESTTDPDYFDVTIQNTQVLDLGEIPDNNYAGARGASVGTCLLTMSDCEMLLANQKQWVRLRAGSKITSTKFLHEIDPTLLTITPLLLRDIETAYASDTLVDNCDFVILSDNPAYVAPANSYLISDPTAKVGSGYVKRIRNCRFDNRIDYSINANRSGRWIIDGNTRLGGQTAAIFCTAGATFQCDVYIGDVDCTQLTGALVSISASADQVIKMWGNHRGSAAANITLRSGTIGNVTLTNNRKLLDLSAVPAEGWKGDRVVSNSPAYVTEWTCTTSSATAATWRATDWIVNKGTTANRPTLTASDIGVNYLDSTLDADGKPIWYTGTAWVDATGLVV